MPLQLRAKQSGDSRTQVQRYIRLTELIPPILQMVDEGQIALTPAVELSFLKKDEQENLRITMESENAAPSFSQAKRMKKLSRMGRLDTSFHASDVTSTPRKTEGVTKKGAFSSPIRAKNWLGHHSPELPEKCRIQLIKIESGQVDQGLNRALEQDIPKLVDQNGEQDGKGKGDDQLHGADDEGIP